MDSDVAELLHSLDEAKARRLLEGLGQRAALREFDRQCAIRFATGLLRQHVGTTDVRQRIMKRYNVSERTAFRYYEEAVISHCHSARDGGSSGADDGGLNEGPTNRTEETN